MELDIVRKVILKDLLYQIYCSEFEKQLLSSQEDLPPEYSKTVDDNFWEIV